jgi:hypothetical protein
MMLRKRLPEDIKAIVTNDYFKNHSNSGRSLREHLRLFSSYIESGGEFYQAENAIFRYEIEPDKTVLFHSMNGGNGVDLSNGINEFLKNMSSEYKRAITYYDNPKINELARFSEFPTHITLVNGGKDMTYLMVFDLVK